MKLYILTEEQIWVFFWSGVALVFLMLFIITNFKQFKKK